MGSVRARQRGVALPRLLLRVCAGVFALLGTAALATPVGPRIRAEAGLKVAEPFTASALLRALRPAAPGVTARADGSQVLIASTASNRRGAHGRVETAAHDGLDAGLRHFVASARRQIAAARSSEARATRQLANFVDRTGLLDPALAYQRQEPVVHDLERQHDAAAASGTSLGAVDASLAENQQVLFELGIQVTRHDQLVQAEARALQQERSAAATRDAATTAARSATVVVTYHETKPLPQVPLAGAAFGLAAIALLIGELRGRTRFYPQGQLAPRDGADPSPIVYAAASRGRSQREAHLGPERLYTGSATASDTNGTRSLGVPIEKKRAYLKRLPAREQDFYFALAPPQSEEPDLGTSIDLVREEEAEQTRDT